MKNDDDRIQALMKLGLTYLQAKTYVTLANIGQTGAKIIAKAANIDRSDLYRVLASLQELGLAEKIIATPTQYKATPLKEGLLMLLQKRAKQHFTLQEEITRLLNNSGKNIDASPREDANRFEITSEKKLFMKKMEKAFVEDRTCEMIFPKVALNYVLLTFLPHFKMALKRGMKIRIITVKSESQGNDKNLRSLMANSLFEIKFINSPIAFGMILFNESEVHLCISGDIWNPSAAVPSLYTNNSQVVKMAQTLFKNMWDIT
jgi:sugar-specific transcriptional regulator TrmB